MLAAVTYFYIFMSSPPDIVGDGRLLFPAVHPPRSSGQILLSRYLMNGFGNLDETYMEYSIATDVLIRC